MGWMIFGVVDLYIGLIVLDAMSPTLPPEKLPRLRAARKVVIALLVVSGIALAVQIARHYGWMRP